MRSSPPTRVVPKLLWDERTGIGDELRWRVVSPAVASWRKAVRAEVLPLGPAHSLAQTGDMRSVVRRVPGIQRQHAIQVEHADFRMTQRTCEVGGIHSAQKCDPARVDRP